MVLNYLWLAFFLLAFIVAAGRLLFCGDVSVFSEMLSSTFVSARTAFEISLGMTGVLALWMGIMRVGERGGVVRALARALSPVFARLFPEVPKGHPVYGSIFMNIAANLLGLDNAATPLGLKAMQELQELNSQKERATDAMIMFLVLNTSGLTIIPVSIMVYRAQLGAANASDIFIPLLLATLCSTLVGVIVTSLYQRINLLRLSVIGTLAVICLFVAGIIYGASRIDKDTLTTISTLVTGLLLMLVIVVFLCAAAVKGVNVYDTFVDGAKEGFSTAVRIIPFLVAMLVAIGVFRASGALDMLIEGLRKIVVLAGGDGEFVGALPTALMKPLSGSGARGLMIDAMTTFGADSFVGRLSCLFQGSCDTTFYILAVYFGSVGIRYPRHAVACGLLADFAGVVAAIAVAYIFF